MTSIIGIVDPAGATEDSRENMERPVCGNVGAIARGIGGRSRSKMQRGEERQEEGPKIPKHCVVDAGVQCLCGGNGEETPRTGTRFSSIHGPDQASTQFRGNPWVEYDTRRCMQAAAAAGQTNLAEVDTSL